MFKFIFVKNVEKHFRNASKILFFVVEKCEKFVLFFCCCFRFASILPKGGCSFFDLVSIGRKTTFLHKSFRINSWKIPFKIFFFSEKTFSNCNFWIFNKNLIYCLQLKDEKSEEKFTKTAFLECFSEIFGLKVPDRQKTRRILPENSTFQSRIMRN